LRDNAFASAGQRGGHLTRGFEDAIMFALEVLDKASSLTPAGGVRTMTAKAAVKTGVWGTIKGWVRGTFNKASRPDVVRGTNKQFGKKFGEHRDSARPGYRTHQEYRERSNEILNDPASKTTRFPSDHSRYPGETHMERNGELLRLDPDGNFRSLYPTK
jgi:hypothetical protein